MIGPVDPCRDLRPHFAAIVSGHADGRELLRLSDHLAEGCAACATELDALSVVFLDHALGFEAHALPPGLVDRVVAAAERQPQDAPEDVLPWPRENELRFLRWMLGFAALAVAAVGLWGFRIRADRDAATEALADAERRQVQQGALAAARGDTARQAAALFDPTARVIDLRGTEGRGTRLAVVKGGAAVIVSDLPEAQPGRAWLWWARGRSFLPIGVLPWRPPGVGAQLHTLSTPVPLPPDGRFVVSVESDGDPPLSPAGPLLFTGDPAPAATTGDGQPLTAP